MNDKRAYAALGLLAGICAALTALAAYAFATEATEPKTRLVATYEESGVYSYTVATEAAPSSPLTLVGPIAPAAGNPTADVKPPAIATDKARSFDFNYTYELRGDALDVTGTVSATLELSAGESWSEKRDLAPATPFQGATGSLSASLDFRQIGALLQQVEQRIGASAEEYELVITPLVKVQGSIGGAPFEETFSTPLAITYTDTEIVPSSTLGFVEPRTLEEPFTGNREVGLFGPAVAVKTLRLVATPLAVIALLGATALGIALLVTRTPATRETSAPPRPTLVSVATVVSGGGPVIGVASLQELEKLARNHTVFVRQFDSDTRVYFVHDGPTIYHFGIGDVPVDWIETPGAVASVAQATPEAPAEPEEAEEIPAWMTAAEESQQPVDEEPEAAAAGVVAPDGGAFAMEAPANGESWSGANGHYEAGDNGYEPPEAEPEEPAGPEAGELAEASIEEETEETDEAGEEPQAAPGIPPVETAPWMRPAYARNREGAERARAWLKRRYAAGRLGEQPAHAADRSEAQASLPAVTAAAAGEEPVTGPEALQVGATEADVLDAAVEEAITATKQVAIDEALEAPAGEVATEEPATTVETFASDEAPEGMTVPAGEPATTVEAFEDEEVVESVAVETPAEEPATDAETFESEVVAEGVAVEMPGEEPMAVGTEDAIEATIPAQGTESLEATAVEATGEEPTTGIETFEVEGAVEGAVEGPAVEAPVERPMAVEIEEAVAAVIPEQEIEAPDAEREPAAIATAHESAPAEATPPVAPVRPPARPRPRTLGQQIADYARKRLRDFLEYPPSQ